MLAVVLTRLAGRAAALGVSRLCQGCSGTAEEYGL
jgi:hypothetical protein